MREYAKLGPTFWTGETGKALRKKGPKALLIAAYLISSPHSNMLGLYYQPVMYMAHETGLGIEGASEGLDACIECGFCSYDHDTEMVWVHEMAAWQIAGSLSSGDKRCKGIQKDYEALPENPFLWAWFDRYAAVFHLTNRREKPEVHAGEQKGHTKPLRSQEQEQEQEQSSSLRSEVAVPRRSAAPPTPPPDFDGKNAEVLNGKAVVAIAPGFELPDQWGFDAEALGFKPPEVLRQAEKFRQYWTAGKGSGTRRSVKGWRQTWSNWLDKAAKDAR